MMRREFLQLAKVFDNHNISGWFVSEKLDGQRCLWDGGFTRHLPAHEVPWANTAKDTKVRVSTGLWSRYCKPIHAPDWWIDKLPKGIPLDGELYIGRGTFQKLESTVRKHNPIDSEWENVKFHVFDAPAYHLIFQDGLIKNPTFTKEFKDIRFPVGPPQQNNAKSYSWLLSELKGYDNIIIVEQTQLPQSQTKALEVLDELLISITNSGGEGLMLKSPYSIWTPKRHSGMLKVKPYLDSEATIVDFIWGDGKYLGMLGAILVEWNGIHFELGTGLTDFERQVSCPSGIMIPRTRLVDCKPDNFSIGDQVNFRYRELTKDGVPKEGRFIRRTSGSLG